MLFAITYGLFQYFASTRFYSYSNIIIVTYEYDKYRGNCRSELKILLPTGIVIFIIKYMSRVIHKPYFTTVKLLDLFH